VPNRSAIGRVIWQGSTVRVGRISLPFRVAQRLTNARDLIGAHTCLDQFIGMIVVAISVGRSRVAIVLCCSSG